MNRTILFAQIVALMLTLSNCTSTQSSENEQWSEKRANEWYSQFPWLAGCDYIPSSAINQIEMWSDSTWDAAQIDKELSWAEELGFNTMRVYLSSVVWMNDSAGLKHRMESFLGICEKHGIRPLFVFFDDCWNAESQYGKQPEPQPGIHNSGWVQDPAVSLRADTARLYPVLKAYVQDVLKNFGCDKRVLLWDLYNEPGNSKHGNESLALVKKVFKWAREVNPSQPLTIGVWDPSLTELNQYQLAHSDVISFHCYGPAEEMQKCIDSLKVHNRPLVCTEYMARKNGSSFQTVMPVLKRNHVVAINWGFVAGKTNTIYAWDTPIPDGSEPELWFHDIFRQDGTPYRQAEIDTIQSLTISASRRLRR